MDENIKEKNCGPFHLGWYTLKDFHLLPKYILENYFLFCFIFRLCSTIIYKNIMKLFLCVDMD